MVFCMNAIKTYGNYIKKYAEPHPAVSRKMIDIGLHLEQFRTEHFAAKEMPEAYRKLNTLGVKNTLSALEHPDQTVWSNLFAPVEIFQCFGLNALSMECLSSFLSGFTCEDYFIDRAEQKGIASTLCSYHKNFIGAVDSGVIPTAAFGVTTSMICDGNINTFRHLSEKHQVPSFLIDVPQYNTSDAKAYVTEQLKELIAMLEDTFHQKFQEEELVPIDKLIHTVLLTSQGIPFIRGGEEIMQDKQGEPNSYKSSDAVNQIDWALKAKNRDIFNYIRTLIALRKKHPAFRIPTAEGLEKWLHFLDTGDSGVIAYTLGEYANGNEWKEILVAYNGNRNQADINIPEQDWIIVCHNGQIDLDSQEHLSGGDVSIAASSALILYRQ